MVFCFYLLVLLGHKSLPLLWQANVGQSLEIWELGNLLGGKGKKFGNDMHRSSLISDMIQSMGLPSLQGGSDKRFQFPCGLSGNYRVISFSLFIK